MRELVPLRIVFVLALALAIGCGTDSTGPGDGDGDGDGADAAPTPRVEERSFEFADGLFAEPNVAMNAGDRMIVTLTSTPASVFFNIHSHQDGETTTYIEIEDPMITHDFAAASEGTYWILIGNRSSDDPISVSVKLELFGETELLGWGD